MNNALNMVDFEFESKKNQKATLYTIGIVGSILAIFILWKWDLTMNIPIPVEEGLEVNLGNSDLGSGDDQPFLPGQPAAANQHAYTPPKTSIAKEEEVKDIATDDKDPDAPEIKKPIVTKPKPEATKVPEKDIVKNPPVKNPAPVNNPTPPAPKPKAVFKGVNGEGTGGNEADTYKKGGNQGIAGGTGDQGRPGGDPNSTNYSGPGGRGNAGIAIQKGLEGRKIVSTPKFEDEFNENAKIAMDITVDASGKVISAVYQPRGSTSSDLSYKEIARRKAMQVKFNTSGGESIGTIVFNFKLKS